MPAAIRATKSERLGWLAISLLAILLAGPLIVVMCSPFTTAAPEWEHVLSNLLADQVAQTLLLLAVALATALLIAVPCAWVITMFEFPMRRFFAWALVLPLALPTYIAAYTWAALLGPTGSISLWCKAHLHMAPNIVNLTGLGIVFGLVLYPYIYLPTRAMFARGMSMQMQAARTLGSHGLDLFRRVALPLARPSIVAGALLLAMEVLNDYGAVKYYGVQTLTTGIFRARGGLRDPGSALRIGIVLIVLIALLLWIERRSRRHVSTATDQTPTTRQELAGGRRWIPFLICSFVLFIAVGLPMWKIGGDAITAWSGTDHTVLLGSLANTTMLAGSAMLLVLIVGVLFAFRERHGRRSDIAIRTANLGYVIPGAVIALGALALAGPMDNSGWGGPVLIGSIGLLLYAYCTRFLAVGAQPLFGALRSQSSSLDDAARMLGSSRWRTFVHVNLPLLRPALIAAAMLVAVDVIKELPLTLILRPFNFETLSTSTYRLAAIEQLREAAVPALVIVLCAMVPLFVLHRYLERVGR